MPEPENIGLKIIFLQLNATYRIIKVVHPKTKDISCFCALEDEQTDRLRRNRTTIIKFNIEQSFDVSALNVIKFPSITTLWEYCQS